MDILESTARSPSSDVDQVADANQMAKRDQPAAPVQSQRDFSQAGNAKTNNLPGNDFMNEEAFKTTNQSARPSNQESKGHNPHNTTASTIFPSSLLPKMDFCKFPGRLGDKLNPSQRFKDLDTNEPLKEVCSNSRSSALWHFIFFHLPAVLVTTTLLVLHATKIRWDPSHPTVNELAALQFAAKAQESLILISLTDILLHRIHYGLLGRNGVPLGFLSSPFNIGFSLRYLVSRELWSAMLNPTANRYFHGTTAAMIFIMALLGLSAGPSSAIAMIPRYDWCQLSAKTDAVVRGNPYPMKLESQHIRAPEDCVDTENVRNQTCVNQNLPHILQTLTRHLNSLNNGVSPSINVTVPSSSMGTDRSFTVGYEFFGPINDSGSLGDLAYATTAIDAVADSLLIEALFSSKPQLLFRSEALTLSGKKKWKQPLVAAHCAPYQFRTMNQTSATFSFGDRLYENFTISIDFDDIDFLNTIPVNYGDELYHRTVTSVLDIQHLLRVPVTASILFASSLELFPMMNMVLCLVQGRWAEAEVWLHPVESTEVQSDLGFPITDTTQYMRQKSDPEDVIKMTAEWLRDIGVPGNSSGSTHENPDYQQGYDSCANSSLKASVGSYEARSKAGSCLPAFLAIYLAEALSQPKAVEDRFDRSGEGLNPLSPDSNSTAIFNTYLEHVYAYGFAGSKTIKLAFTILLLQVFIALIHFAVTVFVRQPWHCSAWGSFGQLLTLALRSNAADELRSTEVKVSSSRYWKLMTVVREVGEQRQLEMVVGAHTATVSRGQTNMDVEQRGATQM
uniref:WGS project CBMI000000000 data, contig CS3069_c003267 n=1 Tax=Fusarium clavum TaxID=2594811 RepID=A0A090MJM2_9HYPO|nr:unnamed protein product [Fusarium clavum]